MTEEIKESIKELEILITALDGTERGEEHNAYTVKCIKNVIDCITNLQQKDFESQKEITKLKDKLEQQRKEYQDTYKDVRIEIKEKNERIANLQQENEKLKYNARGQVNDYFKDKYADEALKNAELIDYKSRCEGTINLIDRTIEIIKQQPTKDDSWILSRLYGFKYSLNGSDENETK